MIRLIEVRQPREHDLIGRTFTVAGFGTGFEATVLWRLLALDGDTLGEGNIQGAGSMGVLDDFDTMSRWPRPCQPEGRTSSCRSSATIRPGSTRRDRI